jgi:hypothetical protein
MDIMDWMDEIWAGECVCFQCYAKNMWFPGGFVNG